MSKKIKVYSSFKDSVLVFFAPAMVAVFVWADIDMYVVEGKPLGFAFVLSLVFIAISLALSVFIYSLYGSRMTIDGEDIAIYKWNFITRKVKVTDITKLLFEIRDNETFAITVFVDEFSCKFTDMEKGYNEMRTYFLKSVSQDKIKYIDRTVPEDEE